MRPFLYAWQFMFVAEGRGKYHNVPGDPGGPTKWGITKRSYPHLDIENLTEGEAREIFRVDFWEKVRADELEAHLALAVVDCAFNNGPETAITLLQRAAGVYADGKFGPNTIAAIRRAAPVELLVEFFGYRALYYATIPDPSRSRRGWFNRLFRLKDTIHAFEY